MNHSPANIERLDAGNMTAIRRACLSGCRLLVALTALLVLAGPLCAETWMDSTGAFKIEAQFLGIRGPDLYLKKANGVTIKVPLARLSAESQQLARQLATGGTPAAPATDTPDAAARAFIEGLQAGNVRVVWDALPASYQKDVNEVVQTFAANMDPALWKSGASIAQKAVQVLKQKKQFILNYPQLAEMPPHIKDTAAAKWDPTVDVLETIVTSELADLEKLKTLDVGVFLDGTGKSVVTKLTTIAQGIDQQSLTQGFPGIPVDAMPMARVAEAKITTVKIDGDTATVRIVTGDKTEEEEAVRVEGKWLPKKLVDQWPAAIEQAKAALTTVMPEQIKQSKTKLAPIMMGIEGILSQLLATQTQEEFNQIIDRAMATFAPQPGPGGEMPPGQTPPAATDPFGAPAPAAKPADAADPFGAPAPKS